MNRMKWVVAVIIATSLVGCSESTDSSNDGVAECMTNLQMAGTDMSTVQQMDYCGYK